MHENLQVLRSSEHAQFGACSVSTPPTRKLIGMPVDYVDLLGHRCLSTPKLHELSPPPRPSISIWRGSYSWGKAQGGVVMAMALCSGQHPSCKKTGIPRCHWHAPQETAASAAAHAGYAPGPGDLDLGGIHLLKSGVKLF